MNSEKRNLYLLSCFIPASLLGALFTPSALCRAVSAILLVIAAVTTALLVKKRSIPSIHHRSVTGILAVVALLYTVITYTAGMWVGFTHNATLTGEALLRYILPAIAIIVATEILRWVLLSQNIALASAMAYLIGIFAEFALGKGLAGISGITQFMDIVGLTLFPAITSGMLYHYLAKRYGPAASIVYRLLLSLPVSLLPLAPAIPEVITSFILIILPLAVRVFIDLLYEKKEKTAARRRAGKLSYLGLATLFFCLATIVMVVSGQFRYKLLVIATPSMTGSLNVGDAIIYEEYDGDPIQEGDIVVFTQDNKTMVVHRVIDVQNLNGTVYYTTKGDANESADSGYLTQENIRGVVQFKLSHIGHTSLWLRELFA